MHTQTNTVLLFYLLHETIIIILYYFAFTCYNIFDMYFCLYMNSKCVFCLTELL